MLNILPRDLTCCHLPRRADLSSPTMSRPLYSNSSPMVSFSGFENLSETSLRPPSSPFGIDMPSSLASQPAFSHFSHNSGFKESPHYYQPTSIPGKTNRTNERDFEQLHHAYMQVVTENQLIRYTQVLIWRPKWLILL